MSEKISVDPGSATPPYEQIRAQVSSLIALGMLAPGARIPTIRRLAADLGIAAGTVARAYRELERTGVVETRRRNGTFVAGPPPTADPDAVPGPVAVSAEVAAAAERYIAEGRRAGLDDAALLAALRARLSRQDG